MNRFRIVWIVTVLAALLALSACGPKPEEAPPAEENTAATTETTPAPEPPPAAPSGPTARATLQGAPTDTDFSGTVTFTQEGDTVRVVAELAGVDQAGLHGFHVHETGECTHGEGDKHFTTAGGHFNPTGAEHACPPTEPRHAGDLGNVEVTSGSGRVELTTTGLSLSGPNSVVGKAVILHAGPDDCKTQPTGNSGDRLACGVVTLEGATQ